MKNMNQKKILVSKFPTECKALLGTDPIFYQFLAYDAGDLYNPEILDIFIYFLNKHAKVLSTRKLTDIINDLFKISLYNMLTFFKCFCAISHVGLSKLNNVLFYFSQNYFNISPGYTIPYKNIISNLSDQEFKTLTDAFKKLQYYNIKRHNRYFKVSGQPLEGSISSFAGSRFLNYIYFIPEFNIDFCDDETGQFTNPTKYMYKTIRFFSKSYAHHMQNSDSTVGVVPNTHIMAYIYVLAEYFKFKGCKNTIYQQYINKLIHLDKYNVVKKYSEIAIKSIFNNVDVYFENPETLLTIGLSTFKNDNEIFKINIFLANIYSDEDDIQDAKEFLTLDDSRYIASAKIADLQNPSFITLYDQHGCEIFEKYYPKRHTTEISKCSAQGLMNLMFEIDGYTSIEKNNKLKRYNHE